MTSHHGMAAISSLFSPDLVLHSSPRLSFECRIQCMTRPCAGPSFASRGSAWHFPTLAVWPPHAVVSATFTTLSLPHCHPLLCACHQRCCREWMPGIVVFPQLTFFYHPVHFFAFPVQCVFFSHFKRGVAWVMLFLGVLYTGYSGSTPTCTVLRRF